MVVEEALAGGGLEPGSKVWVSVGGDQAGWSSATVISKEEADDGWVVFTVDEERETVSHHAPYFHERHCMERQSSLPQRYYRTDDIPDDLYFYD